MCAGCRGGRRVGASRLPAPDHAACNPLAGVPGGVRPVIVCVGVNDQCGAAGPEEPVCSRPERHMGVYSGKAPESVDRDHKVRQVSRMRSAGSLHPVLLPRLRNVIACGSEARQVAAARLVNVDRMPAPGAG